VPDVAFAPYFRKEYNYFVAMYHDQGLAPLKALYFDESVNISLNLPIIRTSVDHGTAFDIAYKNKANTLSYINAIQSAIEFVNN
jgi:4-hydroxythreonine-4-phosphate dehydrogenase